MDSRQLTLNIVNIICNSAASAGMQSISSAIFSKIVAVMRPVAVITAATCYAVVLHDMAFVRVICYSWCVVWLHRIRISRNDDECASVS